MADDSLMTLAYEVRWKMLKVLEDVTPEMSLWTPSGLRNHILWNAGHALTVVEALSVATAAGRPARHPDGWFDKFSWQSDPSKVTSWPSLTEVVEKLKVQRDELRNAIAALTPAQLDAPWGDRGRPLRYAITHGLHDEACHTGEIQLLKKLFAKR